VLVLKQSLEHQRKELNDCRAEITSLKMHIEGSFSRNNLAGKEVINVQSQSLEKYEEEIKKLQVEIESLKEKNARAHEPGHFVSSEMENLQTDDEVIEIHEDQGTISNPGDAVVGAVHNEDAQSSAVQPLNENANNHEDTLPKLVNPANTNSAFENIKNDSEQNVGQQEVDTGLHEKSDIVSDKLIIRKNSKFVVLLASDICRHHYLLVTYDMIYFFENFVETEQLGVVLVKA